MTKKILEDPLVNIKKREIECTQKILQNPMRLKKKQNVQLEKHTIEDHQLDMILVSRLKSYEKAGLDLAKILSITKHKEKKEHKRKQKKSKLSSEEDEVIHNNEKSTNKQKKYDQKSNNFKQVDKKYNDKQSFEYRDHKHDGNKNRNETYRSESSLDYVNLNKKGKFANESNKYYRNKDNNRRYEGRRSLSKEKHQGSKEENWEKNNPNYEQEAKQRKKLPSDSKRHRSVSSNEELEQKKKKILKVKIIHPNKVNLRVIIITIQTVLIENSSLKFPKIQEVCIDIVQILMREEVDQEVQEKKNNTRRVIK